MIRDIIKIFDRDISRLRREIEAFILEENLWKIEGNITNSSGNLCLHLIGNLNTYIGKTLGNLDYIRDREAEFTLKYIPRANILEEIDKTKFSVIKTLESLKEEDLLATYPDQVLGYEMSTNFFLIHLAAHLSYHLGQINYLRRILE